MRALFVTLLEFLFVLELLGLPRVVVIFFGVFIRFGELSVVCPLFPVEALLLFGTLSLGLVVLRDLVFVEVVDLLLELFVVVVHFVRGQGHHVAGRILERLVTLQTHSHRRLGFLHPLTEFMLVGLDENHSDVEVAVHIADPPANVFHHLEQIRNRVS